MIYRINCGNQWCSGPEHFATHATKPTGPTLCPSCGWPALPGDRASVQAVKEDSNG